MDGEEAGGRRTERWTNFPLKEILTLYSEVIPCAIKSFLFISTDIQEQEGMS